MVFGQRRVVLVTLKQGCRRGRPGLGCFITSSLARFGAPTIYGVLWGDEFEKFENSISIRSWAYRYIDRCCFFGFTGNLFGFAGDFIHKVMEGSLLLGLIILCSFLSSVCGSSSGEEDIGKSMKVCPSSVFGVWIIVLSINKDLVGEDGGKAGGPNVGYVSLLVLLKL